VSDWRDDHERDQLDFDDEDPLLRGQGEGVRVLGTDAQSSRPAPRRGRRAVDDSEEFWGESADDFDLDTDTTVSAPAPDMTEPAPERAPEPRPRSRRGRRAARRAESTPPPESRRRPEPEEASGPVRLPHWTEPPTGEMPGVISGEQPATRPDDDLEHWKSASGQTPRYRIHDSDWAERDFSSPELLKDDSLALGALSERDIAIDEVDEADEDDAFEAEVAARRRGGDGKRRRAPRPRPVPPPRTLEELERDDPVDQEDDEAFEAEVAARRRGSDAKRRQPRRPRPPGTLEEPEPAAPAEEKHGPPADLMTRVLTGVAIAIVALILLRLGRGPATVMVALIVGVAAFELYEAFRRAGYHPATVIGLLGSVSIVGIAYTDGLEAFPLVAVLVVAFTMLWYMLEVVKARPIVNIAITLFGFAYIGVFGAFAGLLLSAPDGTGLIIGLAACAIAYDVFGYFIGSQFGRSRMSPHLSPNKTWEGLVGGMVAAIAVGAIIGTVLAPWNGKISHGIALGIVVAILAPIGDLCESMIKRDLGVKDLGTLLPGHGGVLDRFDAILFCLPAVYYLAVQLNIG
jgi:phosphatidate cytidylyltransferase